MRDLRHVFFGAAVAAVAGLALGGVFKPMLREMTDLDGPQMLAGVSGVRGVPGLQQNAGWTSYSGKVPDYVIGTDWTQPDIPVEVAAQDESEPQPAKAAVHDETPVRVAVAPVKYEQDFGPPTAYPSMGGDILAGMQAAAQPAPPEDAPDEPPPPAA